MNVNTEITITHEGNKLVLPLDQARALWLELNKLFDKPLQVTTVPSTWNPYSPCLPWPVPTYRDRTDAPLLPGMPIVTCQLT